jgi:hypothetical protein
LLGSDARIEREIDVRLVIGTGFCAVVIQNLEYWHKLCVESLPILPQATSLVLKMNAKKKITVCDKRLGGRR